MATVHDDSGDQLAGTEGVLGVDHGGSGVDMSATGGTGHVVKQASAGAAFTTGTIAAANIASLTSAELRTILSDETGTGAAVFGTSPTIAFGAGSGLVAYKANGSLYRTSSATATTAVTTEETLWSQSLPASTLTTDGSALMIRAFGNFAANGNTKTIKMKFGSTSITANNVTAAPNGASWYAEMIVSRISGSSQYVFENAKVGSAAQAAQTTAASETLSGAITMSITGQNGTANASEINLFRVFVDYIG